MLKLSIKLAFFLLFSSHVHAAMDSEEPRTIGELFFPLIKELETIPRPGTSSEESLRLIAEHSENPLVTSYSQEFFPPQWIRLSAEELGYGIGCRIFSQKSWVYSMTPYEDGGRALSFRLKDVNQYTYDNQSRSTYGLPSAPGNRMECLLIETELLEEAVTVLINNSKLKNKKENIYETNNLQKTAKYAFWVAFLTPRIPKIARKIRKEIFEGSGCIVPTPEGLNAGKSNVICGKYNFDQDKMTIRRDGKIWLSEDIVKGKKFLFVEKQSKQ